MLRQNVLMLERYTADLTFNPFSDLLLVFFLMAVKGKFTLEHPRTMCAHIGSALVNNALMTLQCTFAKPRNGIVIFQNLQVYLL